MDTRRCSRCKHEKPLDESNFSREKDDAKGFAHRCKSCATEYAREWRKSKRVRARIALNEKLRYDRDGRERKRAYRNRADVMVRTKMAAPDRPAIEILRDNARRRLGRLVRRGVVVRPEKCRRCGRKPQSKLYALMSHYAAPLDDLDWYCPPCLRVARKAHPPVDTLLERLVVDPAEWREIHEAHVARLAAEGRDRTFAAVDRDTHERVLGHWVRRLPRGILSAEETQHERAHVPVREPHDPEDVLVGTGGPRRPQRPSLRQRPAPESLRAG